MTHPRTISTISEFLLHAGTEYMVIDLSRGFHLLDNQEFFEYENNSIAFPRPRQGHAWLCIMFWNKQLNAEHYIWYIKIPVDEHSLLVSAARDQFLQIVVTSLGQAADNQKSLERGLPDNPFVFTPSQQMRANCSALLKQALLNKEGNFNAETLKAYPAYTYLNAPRESTWEYLSIQNIADLLVFAEQADIRSALIQNVKHYSLQVLNCILGSLECVNLTKDLSDCLIALSKENIQQSTTILRALAKSDTPSVETLISDILVKSPTLDLETLVVIAGRHWQVLSQKPVLRQYMKHVVSFCADFSLFKGIYADLVQIPNLRPYILDYLKEPKLSEIEQQAIAQLVESTGKP
ncbi:DUF3549 family protein [Agaribacter flavus]|uniref:DUF3549 family protein n=1 Tax=Agaribacter flavus TaxID=1902781 RepID=A0ABV7FTW6_9ALTE